VPPLTGAVADAFEPGAEALIVPLPVLPRYRSLRNGIAALHPGTAPAADELVTPPQA